MTDPVVTRREVPSPKAPDWRNPEDYAYAGRLTLHEWAWEFARRNPRYRELWAKYQELQARVMSKLKKTKSQRARQKIIAEFHKEGEPTATELYAKFGIQQPYDPQKNAFEVELLPFFARVDVAPTFFFGTSPAPNNKTQPWPGYPRHVDIRFDLLIPAAVQAEECRKIILGKQEELVRRGRIDAVPVSPKRKPATIHFITHLRLLDAKKADASYREMGRILFSSTSDQRNNAKSMLEVAAAMCESGFRDLLMFPEYPDAPGENPSPKLPPGGGTAPTLPPGDI